MSNAEAFHAKRNFAAGVSNTDRLAIGEGMTDQEQHCLHQSNRNLFRSISSRISDRGVAIPADCGRSEEHTSELQSLMRISYAVFCLKKKNNKRKRENTDKKKEEQRKKTDHIKINTTNNNPLQHTNLNNRQ